MDGAVLDIFKIILGSAGGFGAIALITVQYLKSRTSEKQSWLEALQERERLVREATDQRFADMQTDIVELRRRLEEEVVARVKFKQLADKLNEELNDCQKKHRLVGMECAHLMVRVTELTAEVTKLREITGVR